MSKLAPANEQGGKSLNQEFRQYEQVEKNQVYGLSELEGVDEFDDEYEIKTCDLSLWLRGNSEDKARFVREFGSALEDIGFAILTGHGVDTDLYEATNQRIRDFFETIPKEERQPYYAERFGSVNQGYFPVKETSIIHPDLVEGWVFLPAGIRSGW